MLQGTMECILAASLSGVVFALFSGQPLNILGSTGPMLVLEIIIHDFCMWVITRNADAFCHCHCCSTIMNCCWFGMFLDILIVDVRCLVITKARDLLYMISSSRVGSLSFCLNQMLEHLWTWRKTGILMFYVFYHITDKKQSTFFIPFFF